MCFSKFLENFLITKTPGDDDTEEPPHHTEWTDFEFSIIDKKACISRNLDKSVAVRG